MQIGVFLVCSILAFSQADLLIQSPRCEPVTCLPQPLPPITCSTGNVYTDGYCSSTNFQQAPINIDTTRPIKQVFQTPLTTYNFSSVPSITTWQNKQGNVYYYTVFPDGIPAITGGPLGNKMYEYKGTRIRFGLTDDSGTGHALNGKKYAVESQKVFVSPDGQTAIINILFDVNTNGYGVYETIIAGIRTDGSSIQSTSYNLTLNDLFPASGTPYAFYVGTDTLPPCTPNIFWFVSLAVQYAEPQVVIDLRSLTGPNGVPAAPNYRNIQGTSSNGIIVGLSSSGDT